MPNKMLFEITYPFSNLNGETVDLFHPTLYYGCNQLSMLGLKLIHVSKMLLLTWINFKLKGVPWRQEHAYVQ